MAASGHIVVIKRDGSDGPAYPVLQGSISIGSNKSCDIRIPVKGLSPTQCTITVGSNNAVIKNLSQTTPTLVNNVSVTSKVLVDGDILTFNVGQFRWNYINQKTIKNTNISNNMRKYKGGNVNRPKFIVKRNRKSVGQRKSFPAAKKAETQIKKLMNGRNSLDALLGKSRQVAVVKPQRREDLSLEVASTPRPTVSSPQGTPAARGRIGTPSTGRKHQQAKRLTTNLVSADMDSSLITNKRRRINDIEKVDTPVVIDKNKRAALMLLTGKSPKGRGTPAKSSEANNVVVQQVALTVNDNSPKTPRSVVKTTSAKIIKSASKVASEKLIASPRTSKVLATQSTPAKINTPLSALSETKVRNSPKSNLASVSKLPLKTVSKIAILKSKSLSTSRVPASTRRSIGKSVGNKQNLSANAVQNTPVSLISIKSASEVKKYEGKTSKATPKSNPIKNVKTDVESVTRSSRRTPSAHASVKREATVKSTGKKFVSKLGSPKRITNSKILPKKILAINPKTFYKRGSPKANKIIPHIQKSKLVSPTKIEAKKPASVVSKKPVMSAATPKIVKSTKVTPKSASKNVAPSPEKSPVVKSLLSIRKSKTASPKSPSKGRQSATKASPSLTKAKTPLKNQTPKLSATSKSPPPRVQHKRSSGVSIVQTPKSPRITKSTPAKSNTPKLAVEKSASRGRTPRFLVKRTSPKAVLTPAPRVEEVLNKSFGRNASQKLSTASPKLTPLKTPNKSSTSKILSAKRTSTPARLTVSRVSLIQSASKTQVRSRLSYKSVKFLDSSADFTDYESFSNVSVTRSFASPISVASKKSLNRKSNFPTAKQTPASPKNMRQSPRSFKQSIPGSSPIVSPKQRSPRTPDSLPIPDDGNIRTTPNISILFDMEASTPKDVRSRTSRSSVRKSGVSKKSPSLGASKNFIRKVRTEPKKSLTASEKAKLRVESSQSRRNKSVDQMSNSSDATDVNAPRPDNEIVITPKSTVKLIPELLREKHSTAKKSLSRKAMIDHLAASPEIAKELFKSPVKRKLSQSIRIYNTSTALDDVQDASIVSAVRDVSFDSSITNRKSRSPNASNVFLNKSNRKVSNVSATPQKNLTPATLRGRPQRGKSKTPLNGVSAKSKAISKAKVANKLKAAVKLQKSPKNDLTNVAGVKKLMNTPRAPKSPKNDLSKVQGLRKLYATPRPQRSPKNDLTNVAGVKKFVGTPRPPKSPKNDLRNVAGVKALLRSPRVQKSPKNDLTNVQGLKKLLATPKVIKSPKDDLRNVSGVKNLLKSPRAHKSPKNDLTNVSGVKTLLKSPRAQKSPKNDLTNVQGVKRILKTPKVLKSPKNDLSNIVEMKQIFKTPRGRKSPENNLLNISGVGVLLKSPTVERSLGNSKADVSLGKLIRSPNKSGRNNALESSPRQNQQSPNKVTNVSKKNTPRASTKTVQSPKNSLEDVSGVRDLFGSISENLFDSMTGRTPIKTYNKKPFVTVTSPSPLKGAGDMTDLSLSRSRRQTTIDRTTFSIEVSKVDLKRPANVSILGQSTPAKPKKAAVNMSEINIKLLSPILSAPAENSPKISPKNKSSRTPASTAKKGLKANVSATRGETASVLKAKRKLESDGRETQAKRGKHAELLIVSQNSTVEKSLDKKKKVTFASDVTKVADDRPTKARYTRSRTQASGTNEHNSIANEPSVKKSAGKKSVKPENMGSVPKGSGRNKKRAASEDISPGKNKRSKRDVAEDLPSAKGKKNVSPKSPKKTDEVLPEKRNKRTVNTKVVSPRKVVIKVSPKVDNSRTAKKSARKVSIEKAGEKKSPKKVLVAKSPSKRNAVKTSAKKVSPKKAVVKVSSKKAAAKASPKTVAAKASPKKVAAKASPKKVAAKTSPKKVAAKTSPKKVAAKTSPKKVAAKPSSKKTVVKASPKKAAAKPSSKKAVVKASPKKAAAKASKKAAVKASPKKTGVKESSKKSAVKASPKKAASKLSPKKLTSKSASKKTALPKKTAPKNSPKVSKASQKKAASVKKGVSKKTTVTKRKVAGKK